MTLRDLYKQQAGSKSSGSRAKLKEFWQGLGIKLKPESEDSNPSKSIQDIVTVSVIHKAAAKLLDDDKGSKIVAIIPSSSSTQSLMSKDDDVPKVNGKDTGNSDESESDVLSLTT